MKHALTTVLGLLLALAPALQAQDRPRFAVGTAAAQRGQKARGVLEVPAGSDAATRIPVAVVHGTRPGPVLAIVSGAHGTEYASIIAVYRLIDRLDPAQVQGTVILVPLVNVASFEQKVAHVNPVDGKSMNRMYPGKLDGTQTDRASYLITKQVVEPCDHLIDLHGGDLDESLRPYSYWSPTGNEKQDAVSRDMALAFGLDHIIISTNRPKDPAASRYLENTATTRGKPSFTAEAGHAGTTEPEDVDALLNGCLSVMRYLKMLPGAPTLVENPVWIETVAPVLSDTTGIFQPLVKRGAYVQSGMKIGTVTDYSGQAVFEARSPASGVVLFIRAVPSMTKGETIANIGVPASAPPLTKKADLVLRNGTVYTMDSRRPKAQAVAIVGNRIAMVGTNEDVAPLVGSATKVIDLGGRTVIPGFKDSHGHLLGIGMAKMTVNLVGTKSYREVVDRVAAAVKTRKPGEWIVGRGWHEGKWTDTSTLTVRGFPTHDALSAVSPNNPVYLTRADGHAGFANAKAMALMAITRETKPPAGGEIIKDKDGRPAGIFVDRAQALIKVPRPTADETRRALELGIRECIEKGVTSFDDAGVALDALPIYKNYARQGKLDMRLYVMVRDSGALRQLEKPEIGLGNGFLTIRAIKLVADGALGSRGAALLEPYADDPGNSGFFTTPPETVLETARYALAHGFQLNVHAIGDRANRMVLDTFEQAFKEFPEVRDPRFRDEHAQILSESDIPRFAKLGVIASMQGIHATSDRPWAESRLGPGRIKGAYAWQKLLKSGALIINGTDAPVEDVDPVKCFYASVTRQDENGNPPGGFDPEERMTREQALRSYTLDAAYGSFEEKDKGSIEVGKLADLTVLSKDIMTVPETEILKAEIAYTIVDGRIRFEKQR